MVPRIEFASWAARHRRAHEKVVVSTRTNLAQILAQVE